MLNVNKLTQGEMIVYKENDKHEIARSFRGTFLKINDENSCVIYNRTGHTMTLQNDEIFSLTGV